MTKPLIECVANYSEARRPEVVEEIRRAIQAVPEVIVLDQHSDMDHNRTVITFAGPPQPVGEAAFRSIARAAELINLDQHQGEHPRIGASDVVPFVPITGVTMQECVELARQVGKRVGEELGIPVYLYEEAATSPVRKNLENIRRGQYEGLITEISSNPDRLPDFGPARLGPAGATVIGARQFLIAFNVYLTTGDVSVARKVAKAIRHSSGGLKFVKGLGLLVDGQAQVSMNLTNFRETPVARVVEMIRTEAARYGVSIHHSELVGLIPQDALEDAAVWYLQLDQFEQAQVLERRMQAAFASPQNTVQPAPTAFLDALAGGTPAPGGGSASAYSGAAAAALVAMVARLTIGKKKYSGVEAQMQHILECAEAYRCVLTEAVQQDADAFDAVMAAFRLPKESQKEQEIRAKAVQQATWQAAQVPLGVAWQAVAILDLAVQVVSHGNLSAISDGASAAAQAMAALLGAGYNVRINSIGLADRAVAEGLVAEVDKLEQQARVLEAEIRNQLKTRGKMPLA